MGVLVVLACTKLHCILCCLGCRVTCHCGATTCFYDCHGSRTERHSSGCQCLCTSPRSGAGLSRRCILQAPDEALWTALPWLCTLRAAASLRATLVAGLCVFGGRFVLFAWVHQLWWSALRLLSTCKAPATRQIHKHSMPASQGPALCPAAPAVPANTPEAAVNAPPSANTSGAATTALAPSPAPAMLSTSPAANPSVTAPAPGVRVSLLPAPKLTSAYSWVS